MLSITIERTSLGLLPLSISDDGTGTYTLMPGFDAGVSTPENSLAESRWLDGAALVASRRVVTQVSMIVRVDGPTANALQANIAMLAQALDQFDYNVRILEGSTVTTYACMPATWRRVYDADEMRRGRDLVVITIPRQP